MYAYIDLLEKSHEYDVAVARAETKRKNLKARLSCDSYSDRQFVKRYLYLLTKELTRENSSKSKVLMLFQELHHQLHLSDRRASATCDVRPFP